MVGLTTYVNEKDPTEVYVIRDALLSGVRSEEETLETILKLGKRVSLSAKRA